MTDHTHDWQPDFDKMARYRCACGASGYRAQCGPAKGTIVAHVHTKRPKRVRTASASTAALTNGTARLGFRQPGSH